MRPPTEYLFGTHGREAASPHLPSRPGARWIVRPAPCSATSSPTTSEIVVSRPVPTLIAPSASRPSAARQAGACTLRPVLDKADLAITVCHLPPGTSKWNQIEHRLAPFAQLIIAKALNMDMTRRAGQFSGPPESDRYRMTAWGRLDTPSGTELVVHELAWHIASAEFALRSSAARAASSTAPSARLEAAVLGHQTDHAQGRRHRRTRPAALTTCGGRPVWSGTLAGGDGATAAPSSELGRRHCLLDCEENRPTSCPRR